MSGGNPLPGARRVKLTSKSAERFGKWAETASAEDFQLASEILMRIVEGTWRAPDVDWHQDPTRSLKEWLASNGLV
jgi:hypothetical protein